MALIPVVCPDGTLICRASPDCSEESLSPRIAKGLRDAFRDSSATGLFYLGTVALQEDLPQGFAYFRQLSQRFLSEICRLGPDHDQAWAPVPLPDLAEQDEWLLGAPPGPGMEWLDHECIVIWWNQLDRYVRDDVAQSKVSLSEYLNEKNPAWHLVGRVSFHLAENKQSETQPFAFLATYTHRLSRQGTPQHLPLGRALKDCADAKNLPGLRKLLQPVQRAARESDLVRELLESKRLFHALPWTPDEAYRFLSDIPLLERNGVIVRVPDWWKGNRPRRVKLEIQLESKPSSKVGLQALLRFSAQLSLGGSPLSVEEWEQLKKPGSRLVSLRGEWVEVDEKKLTELLEHWKKVASLTESGLTFAEGMRWLAGLPSATKGIKDTQDGDRDWVEVHTHGDLKQVLESMHHPEGLANRHPGKHLMATLRPYQQVGVNWLDLMYRLGLGACLADDMGLGKTLQVIALLLLIRDDPHRPNSPSLLIVPASLLGNWQAELNRFAPRLKAFTAHPSKATPEEMAAFRIGETSMLHGIDLVISTYAMLSRLKTLTTQTWNVLILDEAQAIKNPRTIQTREVKALKSRRRVAMTGTPIENRLEDLWSIFDFLCPNLLGTAQQFSEFVLRLENAQSRERYAPLRKLISPYILRRLKTDKTIIRDLPDKTELQAYCYLTTKQARLYQRGVDQLTADLAEAEGADGSALVLTYLTKFKQICNHPSLWSGDGVFDKKDSGKCRRLQELATEIASREEKLLVFTQFREMTHPLAEQLEVVFRRPGLTLHGGTNVRRRQELVDLFQRPDGPPFFVVSLKAGGIGLNLTAASHVIHFDRWWNPAVENQATDRAFRIGQKRHVLVHKFVCLGTIEERIDKLIAQKQELSGSLLPGSAEKLLTSMSNQELIDLIQLDLQAIAG